MKVGLAEMGWFQHSKNGLLLLSSLALLIGGGLPCAFADEVQTSIRGEDQSSTGQEMPAAAVLPVTLSDPDWQDGKRVAGGVHMLLEASLVAASRYRIIESSEIDRVLQEVDYQNSGLCETECVAKIGEISMADLIFIPSLTKSNEGLQLTVAVRRMSDDTIGKTASPNAQQEITELAANEGELLGAVEKAVVRLVGNNVRSLIERNRDEREFWKAVSSGDRHKATQVIEKLRREATPLEGADYAEGLAKIKVFDVWMTRVERVYDTNWIVSWVNRHVVREHRFVRFEGSELVLDGVFRLRLNRVKVKHLGPTAAYCAVGRVYGSPGISYRFTGQGQNVDLHVLDWAEFQDELIRAGVTVKSTIKDQPPGMCMPHQLSWHSREPVRRAMLFAADNLVDEEWCDVGWFNQKCGLIPNLEGEESASKNRGP